MKSKDTQRLHPGIDPKLAVLVRSSPVPPPWHEAWLRLGPGSTHEDRLKVCQAVRDAGTVPEDAGYFLVSWAAEHLAEDEDARRADPLRTLNAFEVMRASDRDFAALLESHGEGGMAALFRTNPEEHAHRREASRLFFFGPIEEEAEDPDWLEQLLQTVAARVVASRPIEGLAYRYRPHQFVRELHVCPAARTGNTAGPGWAVDVERLREAFDKIDGCGWYAAPAEKGESPYLWIEGEFDGREVFLRLLPDATDTPEKGKGYQTWRPSSK